MGVKSIHGIDISEYLIKAANLFASTRKTDIHYNFQVTYAEDLPFGDETFDNVITYDTLEHIRSVKVTLKECKRTLKPGGMMLCVFPSYYFPLEGAHLGLVTKTPFLEWIFSPSILNTAYQEIIEERGEEAYWYGFESFENERNDDWALVYAGIGINGITYRKFVSIAKELQFAEIKYIPIPLFPSVIRLFDIQ